jgi:uncharacterized protein with FMN-binding domain
VRRAALALVVTIAAVWLLASYRSHPPRRLNPQAALYATPAPAPARTTSPRPRPGVRTGRGPLISTPFSTIQVEAELTHGRLTGVRTVHLSSDDPHTKALNKRAEPILREEALRAGSADVDVVSGATYTSESWKESLQAAIDDARG